MATLERIRRRSGLLIIVIGVAMFAFILTDFFTSGSMFFSEDRDAAGFVGNEKISSAQLNDKMEEIRASNPQMGQMTSVQLANYAWNEITRDIIMGELYSDLGFEVTNTELYYEITHNPQIRQMPAFADQVTGQFSDNAFRAVINNMRENRESSEGAREQWMSWVTFENATKDQSRLFKFNKAVEMGLYTPASLAKHAYLEQGAMNNVQFVLLPFTSIVDSTVEVSDADYTKYYNAHKSDFEVKEEVRNIRYVNFNLVPSEEDRNEVKTHLASLLDDQVVYNQKTGKTDTVKGFRHAENDSVFVGMNSETPFNRDYFRKGRVSAELDSIVFDAPVGFMYGPYEEAGGFKLTKISGIRYLPDSVKAKHILISYQGATRSNSNMPPQQAYMLADSLFKYVKENPSAFEAISEKHSTDVVAKSKGGDLGWFDDNSMAKPFSDYCFNNKKGDIGFVPTEFGFHIIQIEDQKGSNKAVQLATVYQQVQVSKETENGIYAKAAELASKLKGAEDADAVAAEMGVALRPQTDMKAFDENIIGLGSAREVVRWVFNADRSEGDVEVVNNQYKSYVVIVVDHIVEADYKPLNVVKEAIKPYVYNEVKAKALTEQMSAQMSSAADLQALADGLDIAVRTQTVTIAQTALSGAGSEPSVVGHMAAAPQGKLSGPYTGNMGVYAFVVTSKSPANDLGDYTQEAGRYQQSLRQRVNGQLLNALKDKEKIVDKRYLFF